MIGENRKKYYGSKLTKDIFTDKDFITIGDKIADIFGFKLCDFGLENATAPNAYTVPCGNSIKLILKRNRNLALDNDTGELSFDKKTLSTVIRVTTGLYCNEVFTDAEVTAIILHEIGHNFQHEINSFISRYMNAMRYMKIITTLARIITGMFGITPMGMGMDGKKKRIDISGIFQPLVQLIVTDPSVQAKMNSNVRGKFSGKIIGSISYIFGLIASVLSEIVAFTDKLTLGLGNLTFAIQYAGASIMVLPISLLVSGIGKGQENVADSFASEYGYGPDLISALAKIEIDPRASATNVDKEFNNFPLLSSIYALNSLPLTMVTGIFGTHPLTGKRAVNVVIELENEIKYSNLSPKMKKEVQAQIDEIKEITKSYDTLEKDGLSATAIKGKFLNFIADYDKDKRGAVEKLFSTKDMYTESAYMLELAELFDEDIEYMEPCIEIGLI